LTAHTQAKKYEGRECGPVSASAIPPKQPRRPSVIDLEDPRTPLVSYRPEVRAAVAMLLDPAPRVALQPHQPDLSHGSKLAEPAWRSLWACVEPESDSGIVWICEIELLPGPMESRHGWGYNCHGDPEMNSQHGTVRLAIVFFASLSVVFHPSEATAQPGSTSLVISQIYGGGGNQGATLTNDFVELFNRGGAPVDVTGWTVQYASASGGNWQRTELAGTVQPGQYYLVQEKQGAGGSVALPAPDAIGGIGLSASSGKVALVSNSTALSGSSPTGSQIVDLVGYGSANFAEGSPAGTLGNTTAAIRKSGGCVDTDNNTADFDIAAPAPRNTQSPLSPCGIPAGPQISEAGVTNAASYIGGAVAPGEIITIFGSNLGPSSLVTLQLAGDGQHVSTELGGTRVLFDGVAAPMIYAWKGQVSVVVPYSVSERTSTVVEVEYDGKRSNSLTLRVAPSAPGIFTLDSSGRGQGAILNQDYSVNGPSAPAGKDSVVMIYATGGGQTEPAGEDGKVISGDPPRTALPVSVQIGGIEAEVLYAGAAPGMVSGVLQINAKVPQALTIGGPVSVQISVGEATSQPGVTLSVEGGSQWSSTPEIEQKFAQLKTNPSLPELPEIPHDRIGLPPGWLGLISWNIQVGGTSTSPTACSAGDPQ